MINSLLNFFSRRFRKIDRELMNKTFVYGSINLMLSVRNVACPILEIIKQVKFKANQNLEMFFGLAVSKTNEHAEEAIYKQCGFLGSYDYRNSLYRNDDSRYYNYKSNHKERPQFAPMCYEDYDVGEIQTIGISTYYSLGHFDKYQEIVENLMSNKAAVFIAPTVDEVLNMYKDSKFDVVVRYKDLWFCSDWKGLLD